VITATITHQNDDVRTLTLDGGETLFVTGNHRMFSATANDWVPVQDLEIGEELQTTTGRKSVASLGYQHGRHQVYNVEVEAEHCYFVGDGETLTHNMCGPDGESLALTHSANSKNKGVPPPDGGFSADLSESDATSASGQRNAANKQLNEAMSSNSQLRADMEKKSPGAFEQTSTSGGGRRNPQGYEWDHNNTRKNQMDLRSKENHLQKTVKDGRAGGGWKRQHGNRKR
jgi:hypothetical protein